MPRWEVWSADETALLVTFGINGYPFFSATVRADRNADCRYAATLELPNIDGQWSQDETNPGAWVFAENNILKCFDADDTPRFYGLIDDAVDGDDVGGIPTVQVQARSIEKKQIQECFTDTTTYTDTPIESANYAASTSGATAAASSYVQVGDQLQLGAKVSQVTGRKKVLGIWQTVSVSQDAGAVKDGNAATKYSWSLAENGLSNLELTVRLDLWTPEGIQRLEAVPGSNTTVFSVKTSQDGLTWDDQTNPVSSLVDVRFIEVVFRASGNGSVTLEAAEIQALASSSYQASAALDADTFTSWRPTAGDLVREITVSFGTSRTFNAVYLQFGVNPLDVWDTVQFKLYTGSTLIYDGTDRWYSGLVEIALAATVTASSIKIKVVKRSALTAIRHIEVLNVTADQNRVSWLLSDLAADAGIPAIQQEIPASWLWRAALTATIGDNHWQHSKEVAEAVGWELYGDTDGKLKAGPVILDAAHPAGIISTDTARIVSVEKQPPQNIKNYIIVISEQSDETIRGEAKDDSVNSPTSTQRMGNRVQTITDNTITQQKAADQRAILELWQSSAWRSGLQVELADASFVPGIGLIYRFIYAPQKIDGVFLVETYSLDMEPGYMAVSEITLVPVG